VRAGYELLAERGFEGLRTREIAARVGINIATLHYYFPTKEKLVRGVVGYAMGRFRGTLVTGTPPGEQLRAHFAGLRRLAREEPDLFVVMSELALRARRDRAIASIVREMDKTWQATLAGLLKRAKRDGAVTRAIDPDELAGLIVATLKGTFMLPAEARGPRQIETRLRALEDLIA